MDPISVKAHSFFCKLRANQGRMCARKHFGPADESHRLSCATPAADGRRMCSGECQRDRSVVLEPLWAEAGKRLRRRHSTRAWVDPRRDLQRGLRDRSLVAAGKPVLPGHRKIEGVGAVHVIFLGVDHHAAEPFGPSGARAQDVPGAVTTATCKSRI